MDTQQKQANAETLAGAGMPAWMKGKRIINIALLSFLPLFGIFYQEVFYRLGIYIYKEVYTMVIVGVSQFLVYMNFPALKKNRKRGQEYQPNVLDIIMGIIGLVGGLYIAFNWNDIYILGGFGGTLFQNTLGWLFIIVVLESARRLVGLPLVIVAILFLLYAGFGNYIPGMFHTAKFTSSNIVGYVYLSAVGIFGTAAQTIAGMVLAFTVFGVVLQMTNAGKFYLNLSLAFVGKLRGGAAKVAVFCSMLFATMTGEPTSNLGIIAPLSYPFMKKMGYSPVFSGAVLAVSSCGSMIMPPVMGAVVFLMGEMTGLGFPTIMVAAIIPAILYYVAVYLQVDFYCANKNYPKLNEEDIPDLKNTLKSGWYFIIPIAVLVYFLLGLKLSAASAVYYSTAILILISLIKKEDREAFIPMAKTVLPESGRAILNVIGVTSCSGIIMAIVTLSGIGLRLSALLTTISGGNLIVLALMTAVAIYIMGMGMAPIVSYILMSILVAPALVGMGVPVIAAHFFILYMSVSGFITPPVAIASYVAGGVVGESGIKVGFRAMRLGIVCYMIPFVCLFSPALLLVGSTGEIIQSAITAFIGVVFLASGLEGYLFVKVPIWQRILLLAGGVLLFIPGSLTDIIGIALAVVPAALQIKDYRKLKAHNTLAVDA